MGTEFQTETLPTADGMAGADLAEELVETPTRENYDELQAAYDFFNRDLFGGRLPAAMITLQREKRSEGYFSGGRFVNRTTGELTDELAMNPAYFAIRPIREVLQTLVHEMVHLEQAHFGRPGRGRYHNRQWAQWMERVGLMASSTGRPGGMKTGDHMRDYVIEGGPFDLACAKLLTADFTISWLDRFPPELPPDGPLPPPAVPEEDQAAPETPDLRPVLVAPTPPDKSNRVKYRCPECEVQVWGKPGLVLLCGAEGHRGTEMPPIQEGREEAAAG